MQHPFPDAASRCLRQLLPLHLTGLLLTAFLYLPQTGSCQTADSIRTYIKGCLSVLKKRSLYANAVNWPATERKVLENAKGAKTKAETFDALKIAFNALGDKHAAYHQYNDSYKPGNTALMTRYSDSIKAAWTRGPRIDPQLLGDIAYFSVPFMGVNKQEQVDAYANWLYSEIVKLSQHRPRGWIIDLRLNGGGNIKPMLAGLAMFFRDGIVSYYIDKDGKASDESSFHQGNFLVNGKTPVIIKNKTTSIPDAKVAVLIGPGTASSGEITAAVFSRRPNTLLLGDSTAGLANATNGFVFNGGNTYFLISTARIADQHKKTFPETIQPHSFIKGNDAFNDVTNDAAVKKAVDWLHQ